jgi:CRP/FNR family transcriptional regulator, cyclic AMP receptor protein
MPETRRSPLLELDPDLGRLLPPNRLGEATRGLLVSVQDLYDGGRELTALARSSPSHLGLLVVDGVVAREVVLGDTVSTELLGAGDVIRPWTLEEPAGLLESEVTWSALSDVSLALLGRRFAVELCGYPEVYTALIDRLSQRSARLATTQAISQMTKVDRRLLALFWHLAERWGRMTAMGVHVPLRISHRLLGQLIGARRPTISAAVRQLGQSGELVRRADSTWLVTAEPGALRAAGRPAPPRFKLLPAAA